jgi:hypothetical protein
VYLHALNGCAHHSFFAFVSIVSQSPGLGVQYLLDPYWDDLSRKSGHGDTSVSTSTHRGGFCFQQYLSTNKIFLEVWDSDSHLLIGTCSIDPKALFSDAPTGQGANCSILDVDIMRCSGSDLEQADVVMVDEAISVASTRSLGKLHVRLSNCPRTRENLRRSTSLLNSWPTMIEGQVAVDDTGSKETQTLSPHWNHVILKDYHENLRLAELSGHHQKQVIARKVCSYFHYLQP